MKQFFKSVFLALFAILIAINTIGQDRKKAEEAVTKYMSSKYTNYKADEFGEFFEQNYADEIQKEMGTDKKIKYSLVHSYSIDSIYVANEYFHIDEDMNVIGQLSFEKMGDITLSLLFQSAEINSYFDTSGTSGNNKMGNDSCGCNNDFSVKNVLLDSKTLKPISEFVVCTKTKPSPSGVYLFINDFIIKDCQKDSVIFTSSAYDFISYRVYFTNDTLIIDENAMIYDCINTNPSETFISDASIYCYKFHKENNRFIKNKSCVFEYKKVGNSFFDNTFEKFSTCLNKLKTDPKYIFIDFDGVTKDLFISALNGDKKSEEILRNYNSYFSKEMYPRIPPFFIIHARPLNDIDDIDMVRSIRFILDKCKE